MRRALRAMIGLRDQPPRDEGLVFALIDNGRTEMVAFAAWVVAMILTAGVLIFTGQAVHTWQQPARRELVTIAAIPLGISLLGVIIHGVRAATALSSGDALALRKRDPNGYDRLIGRLTIPTPWVLLPQIVIGVAFALLGGSSAVYK